MAANVTEGEMRRVLGILQRLQPWAAYDIGCQMWVSGGGYRLERDGGSIEVSPRGTKREVMQYVRVMLEALRVDLSHTCDSSRYPGD